MRRFEIGEVLSQTFRITFANILPFAFLVGVILTPQLPLMFLQEPLAETPDQVDPALALFYTLLVMLGTFLSIILVYVANGAIAYGVFQNLTGKATTLGDCVRIGFRRMLPIIGVAIVTGLLVFLGSMALVIPGIILYVMFVAAVPAAVIERLGVGEALGRSRELTRGYRWEVFGVVLLVGLINGAIMLAVMGLSFALPPAVGIVVNWLVQIFYTVLQATVMGVVYYELRSIKEPFDEDEIAAVFA
jgi:hypothetical protein